MKNIILNKRYTNEFGFWFNRFRISVICSDESGVIFVALGDSEVRKLIKKNVFEVDLDHAKVTNSTMSTYDMFATL